MFWFILLFVVVGLAIVSWVTLILDTKKSNVPGPFPIPFLGNGHLFLVGTKDFIPLLNRLADAHGDAYRVHLFASRYVVLSHPKYVEPVLSSTELITKGKSYTHLRPWLGYGLLTSTGQKWKKHRKFLTPAFHFNILQNFLPVFCKNEKILCDKLRALADGQPVNLFPIIALTALDNVTESIMGVCLDIQRNSDSEYVKAIEQESGITAMRMRNPFMADETVFNLSPYKTQEQKALAVLHGYTKKVIAERRQELKKLNITSLENNSEFGIKNKQAFLDLLLLSEIDGEKFDDESVREEVDTFMFEGHDTTTSGIVFTLFCISKHKDVQEKILEEQTRILGDDIKRDPTYSELQQMKYLEMVIKESLRLYPSVPLIERLTTKQHDIAGLNVLENTSVLLNIFRLQRHPDLYDEPLEFRPERFDLNNNSKAKNPFNWIAFSAGPRNCIGQKFAMMELKVTVAGVIKQFDVVPIDKVPDLCCDLILRAEDGVHIGLKPRY